MEITLVLIAVVAALIGSFLFWKTRRGAQTNQPVADDALKNPADIES